MQTLDNGIIVPTNSDDYDLTWDMANIGKSSNVVTVLPNATAMQAIERHEGRVAFRSDTGQLVVCTSGVWKYVSPSAGGTPYAMAAGVWSPGSIAAGASATSTPAISFPANRFTVAPLITVTPNTSRLTASYNAVTATSLTLVADNWTSARANGAAFHWTAIQMTPTSAAG